MKEKILAQLILKYAGVSKKFLGLWADKLAVKVTEENQIEGVVNELDNLPISITDLATEYQKEGDSRVIDAKKEWLKTPPKPDKPIKTDTPPADAPPDEMPAWAKTLLTEVQTLKADKVKSTIQEKLAANEKLKGIPKEFYDDWKLPETDEELDTFSEKVSAKYQKVKDHLGVVQQEEANTSGESHKPAASAGGGSSKIDPDIKAFADKKAKENEQKK